MPQMTDEQWRRFITFFSNESPGLSADLQEFLEMFAKQEAEED